MELRTIKIDDVEYVRKEDATKIIVVDPIPAGSHPMLGKRCLVRTYSAGVHIGNVVFVDGMECRLLEALRLWKWEGGGLSLSAVANNGIAAGRMNYTGEVYLTNCIEFIPTTEKAEATYEKFVEDKQ